MGAASLQDEEQQRQLQTDLEKKRSGKQQGMNMDLAGIL